MEGKIVREQICNMAGNLQATLLIIKDDWSHGRMSHEEFMRRLSAIRSRAAERSRVHPKSRTVTTFVGAMSDTSSQWNTLMAVTEKLKQGDTDVHVEGSEAQGRLMLSQAVE
jgi:hypothetical protein